MNEPRPRSSHVGLTTGRLEAVSDGVLAIVITLMILDILDEVNHFPSADDGEIVSRLTGLWPHVLGYILSFMLVAIYWVLHHIIFHHVGRADRTLIWLNMLFLLTVAFVPFPTALLADNIRCKSDVVLLVYGSCHLLTGLTLVLLWHHARRAGLLNPERADPVILRRITQMSALGPCLYALAMALTLLSYWAGLIVFVIIPICYIVPGSLYLHRRE